MAYKEPEPFVKVGDVTLVNYGQGVELQDRLIGGEPNPEFVSHRNAGCRVYVKNGVPIRILVEIGGVIYKDNPLATGVGSCGPLEQQPFFIRLRAEEPTEDIPTAPEVEEIG